MTETPSDSAIRLTGGPIATGCHAVFDDGEFSVRIDSDVGIGQVPVPTWATQAVLSCSGYVEANIDIASRDHIIDLVPGRALSIRVSTPPTHTNDNEDNERSEVVIELTGVSNGFSANQPILLNEGRADFGSIPLGRYMLSIEGERYARLVEQISVAPSLEPLSIEFSLEASLCQPFEVLCSHCQKAEMTGEYNLVKLREHTGPQYYSEGSIHLVRRNAGEYSGEICAIAAGTYEATLVVANSGAAASRFRTAADGTPLILDLEPVLSSSVFLVDTDGIPVSDAVVTGYWSRSNSRSRFRIISDANGEVVLPAAPASASYFLHIEHGSFQPTQIRCRPSDQPVVELKGIGRVIGTIVGRACRGRAQIMATVSWTREDFPGIPTVTTDPVDDCLLEVPIKGPGLFSIRLSSPEFLSYETSVQLDDDLNVDLGEIELESGDGFWVVVHNRGIGIEGAAVKLGRNGPPQFTDPSGEVRISNIPPDSEGSVAVDLHVSHHQYADSRVVADVVPDQEVNVELSEGGSVFGRVVNRDGSSAIGEMIYLVQNGGFSRSATVDGRGTYRVDRLQPDEWTVYRSQSSAQGILSVGERHSVMVSHGGEHEVNFLPRIEVSGNVYVDGVALPGPTTIGAILSAAHSGIGTAVPIPIDESGRFSSLLPAEGTWTFVHSDNTPFATNIEYCPCFLEIRFVSAERQQTE